jgi:WD40 repeat protein
VILRDFETTKEIHRFDDTPRHYSACDLVTWSSDGRFLAIGNVDGAIRVWEVESGRRVLDTQGPKTHVRDLLFLGESIRVASGGIRPDPIRKDPINRGPLYEPLIIWDAPFA